MRIETRIAPILAALLLTAPALSSDKPQSQRCAPNDAVSEMKCVNRNGLCAELTIDGLKTDPLTDGETATPAAPVPADLRGDSETLD